MSTAVLSPPSDLSVRDVPVRETLPPDQLGQYSVADECFLWSAARELEQRCLRHHRVVPSDVASLLRLQNDAQNARSMVNALLAIEDLAERRSVLCQMVHAIVRLR